MLKEQIWLCNLKEEDIKVQFKDSFWRDVLIAWSKVNFESCVEKVDNVLAQGIWYNSLIRINNAPVLNKKAYREGLTCIVQLVDDEGKKLKVETVANWFNVSIMDVNSIFHAVPKSWWKLIEKACVRNFHPVENESNYACLMKKERPNAWYYERVNRQDNILFETYCKWQSKLHSPLSYIEFKKLFVHINYTTNFTKLRSFQFRMLHNAIIMKDRLKIWGITKDDKCELCKKDKETIIHFFMECEIAQQMYCKMFEYASKYIGSNAYPSLLPYQIIFCYTKGKNVQLVNFLLIVTKHYLYRMKCFNQKPNETALIQCFEECR